MHVSLLGRFQLIAGVERVAVAPASQRLLAYVALAGRAVRRDLAAGALWPTVREHLAHGSLRAALARLAARAPGVLRADGPDVSLAAGVDVDLHDAELVARRLLSDTGAVAPDGAAAAIGADPVRESPHAALIAVHLREGNQSEALREFERYRLRLESVLGLQPTARLRGLLPR